MFQQLGDAPWSPDRQFSRLPRTEARSKLGAVAETPQYRPKTLTQCSSEGTEESSVAERTSILIGRGSHCDVIVKDGKASREHCRLSLGEAGYTLEDLKSRNGTYVDGARIEAPTPLRVNQTFKIGDTVFYLA